MTEKAPKQVALEPEHVVVHVAHGQAKHVVVQESDATVNNSEITVRVSSKRKPSGIPVVGVIIK